METQSQRMNSEEVEVIKSFLSDYKEKCSVLKQIHSNKKSFYDQCSIWFNVITIVASLILTIIGFINKDLLYDLFMNEKEKTKSLQFFDLTFNTAVLAVLILSILNLIFRFQDKSFEHNRSIILFSNLLREIKEISTSISTYPKNIIEEKLTHINFKYSNIIDSIPSHSDKDFFRAKEDYYKKLKKSKEIDDKYRGARS